MDVGKRVLGCMLGLAVGDALGAPFEHRRARDVQAPVPAFELPWRGFPPGTTTGTTAMARHLARSLGERGAFDPGDLVARHLAWFRAGPPDMENLTRLVLRRVDAGADAAAAARAVFHDRGPEVSAGNGSVAYCPPLGVAYAHRPESLTRLAPALSGLTHVDERCRTAVLAVALTAAALVRGDEREATVRESVDAVLDHEGGEELEFLVDAAGGIRPVDGPDQGFCLFAAAIGLQAVLGGPFEPELRRVVSLGGDTSANAAVAGALLGAAVGLDGLPGSWLGTLQDRKVIEREAIGLVYLAQNET